MCDQLLLYAYVSKGRSTERLNLDMRVRDAKVDQWGLVYSTKWELF